MRRQYVSPRSDRWEPDDEDDRRRSRKRSRTDRTHPRDDAYAEFPDASDGEEDGWWDEDDDDPSDALGGRHG